jgi:hypothetical protein
MSVVREMRRSQEVEPFYCQECKSDKRKGYHIAFGIDGCGYSWPSFSICDDCLESAKT